MISLFSKLSFYLAQIEVQKEDFNLPDVAADEGNLRIILQLVFGVISLVTVIYIILTGLKLVVQQGDPQGISKARQGLIYASLGLVIALSAELIVTFVLGEL